MSLSLLSNFIKKTMKKLYTLLFLVIASMSFGQTVLTQWNFDDADPVIARNPTTGTGTFATIGGVVDNTSGTVPVMPAGNPSTGKAYSIKTFPATLTASGTAGFEFATSTLGITAAINVQFDPRGSNTSSKWQQYQYSTDGGTTYTVLSNNGGALTNSFTATYMVSLTLPASCSNNANLRFRIVSIFDPAGTDYAAVSGTYSGAGTWRLDNFTFSSGTLKVSQNSIDGLSIYPNPVSNGTLYVTSAANASKNIVIYDVLGKQVINTTTDTNAVNVAGLNAGVYIVKVTEEGKTATRKLVIR